jgi:dolichol-phosphate mannosyltransferase
MKTVIVLPTYNEAGNIERLIHALEHQFESLMHEMHILVVDDNSPDGTADIVRSLQPGYSNVHLLVGRKAGLGAAYIRGISHALQELHADAVFEMDADFSHRPEDVPRLLANLDHGADLVIGSRYVPGGTIPRSWGWLRRANSVVGNIVARYIAGIYRVRDCTAGFRAIRASVLHRIDLSSLRVQGYAFQVALLHAAVAQGAKVVEVPVDFVDRCAGQSKLGLRDILEFVWNAWWIRLQTSRTFAKFAVVGVTGVAVNLALFTWLLRSGLNGYLASPVAIEASIVSNFLLNNYWTFRWRRSSSRLHVKGLKFNTVSLVALGVSYSTFVILTLMNPQGSPQLHQLAGVIPATLINYFLNSYWTFAPETESTPDGSAAGRRPMSISSTTTEKL